MHLLNKEYTHSDAHSRATQFWCWTIEMIILLNKMGCWIGGFSKMLYNNRYLQLHNDIACNKFSTETLRKV